jgi:hypothetical protein
MEDEMDDMLFVLDSRVKYIRCRSGDPFGTLSVSICTPDNAKISKQCSWHYPCKLEVAAINEMMAFIRGAESPSI